MFLGSAHLLDVRLDAHGVEAARPPAAGFSTGLCIAGHGPTAAFIAASTALEL